MGIPEYLEHDTLFAGVDRGLVRRLIEAAGTQSYVRGSTLWRIGEYPHALLFVRSGLVKLTRPAARGRTAVCGLFGAHAILGELVLVKGMPYQNAATAATSNVVVISIPRAAVLEALRADPQLALNLFTAFEAKFSALNDKIDVLSAGLVEARLATMLLKLYTQFGDELADGTLRIGVPLSRQELADMVSTSVETAIRVLARWEREGTLSSDADGFTVGDLAALQRLSGTSYAADAPLDTLAPARKVVGYLA
jgi:CRP/FNR family transcriptional regulator